MTNEQQAIALNIISHIVSKYFSAGDTSKPYEIEASECVFVIDEVLSDQNLTEKSYVLYGVTPPPVVADPGDFDVCMG
jgi:hypothetical protein